MSKKMKKNDSESLPRTILQFSSLKNLAAMNHALSSVFSRIFNEEELTP
jgi:hypothetical protein